MDPTIPFTQPTLKLLPATEPWITLVSPFSSANDPAPCR